MNLDYKVAEVAGKHPFATNTHNPARHRLPPWAKRKQLRDYSAVSLKAPAAAEAPATQQSLAPCQDTCVWAAHPPQRQPPLLQLQLRSAQFLSIKGALCGPRKFICGISQYKVQDCRRWMDGDRRRREKRKRRD